jgi:hypothetical protein
MVTNEKPLISSNLLPIQPPVTCGSHRPGWMLLETRWALLSNSSGDDGLWEQAKNKLGKAKERERGGIQ